MNEECTFEDYQKSMADNKILGVLCADCNTITAPPQAVCRKCSSPNISPKELGKNATLQTFTVIRVAPDGMNPPYIVALAETDDGPWVIGNLIGVDPDKTDLELIGKRVTMSSQHTKGNLYSLADFHTLTFSLQ